MANLDGKGIGDIRKDHGEKELKLGSRGENEFVSGWFIKAIWDPKNFQNGFMSQ